MTFTQTREARMRESKACILTEQGKKIIPLPPCCIPQANILKGIFFLYVSQIVFVCFVFLAIQEQQTQKAQACLH